MQKFYIIHFYNDDVKSYEKYLEAIKLISKNYFVLHNFIITNGHYESLKLILQDASKNNKHYIMIPFENYHGFASDRIWKFMDGKIENSDEIEEEKNLLN